MAISNLNYVRDPKTIEDIRYQPEAVQLFKHWILNDRLPNQLFVDGPSGVGKTSFVKVLVRTLHCLNRKRGELLPCGGCSACLANEDPRQNSLNPDLIWVQSNGVETIHQQLKDISARAVLPNHYGYTIFVIDEVEALNHNQLTQLLYFPDILKLCREHNLIFVFITMNPQRIQTTTYEALIGRGISLTFKQPTKSQLEEYALDAFVSMGLELDAISEKPLRQSAELLALASRGSLRKLNVDLAKAFCFDKNLTPRAVALATNYLDRETRAEMWEMVKDVARKRKGAIKVLADWYRTNEQYFSGGSNKFLELIQDDILEALETTGHPELLDALNIVFRAITSFGRVEPTTVLLSLCPYAEHITVNV